MLAVNESLGFVPAGWVGRAGRSGSISPAGADLAGRRIQVA
jgi:hypothetical protein